ncbi:hypothetical protein M9Y10_014269 [Tritrichomonas musculus]|uniref:Importin N-terminal domain-containing protein n=1 Tax=Tritrichomonas musculus TaxID=1915356 RepID=A0ABR2L087_9EUKA
MDDINEISLLLINFTSNDNNIRSIAEYKIQELIKNDPNTFSHMLFIILQNYQNFPLDTVLLCFIILRNIFSRATNALKTNDSRLSYIIIPQTIADSYVPLVLSFFSNENTSIADNASYLLGKIAVYLLTFDSNHSIFQSLIQQIDNGQLVLPSLKSIYFILLDDLKVFTSSESIQQQFMNKILIWLSDQNFPFDSKPFLIKIITLLIPILSHILLKPEDNNSFCQMMIILTQVPELKFDSYDFWVNLTNITPQLLAYSISPLSQISINDLSVILAKYPNIEYIDEAVALQILQFWIDFCQIEEDDIETSSCVIKKLLPSFMPFLLLNAENTLDTNILPLEEDYSIFTLICDLITSFNNLYPKLSIPILLNYGFQAIESNEIMKKEIGLFAINTAIFQFSSDDEEYLQFCSHCINFSLSIINSEIDFGNTVMLRIVSRAVTNIYNIAYLYPNLIDFSSILPKLVEFMKTPISYYSQILILEIIKNDKFEPTLLTPLITSLLDIQAYQSIDCVWQILNEKYNTEIFDQIHLQIFSILNAILENNTNTDQITPLLQIIALGIDVNNEILTNNAQNFIQIFIKCYENYENPEAIRILSISSQITKDTQLLNYLVEQIISQIDSIESEWMISSCLDSIIFELSSLDISKYFNELMRSLLTAQDIIMTVFIKIKILKAINFLHQSFPLLMQPYLTRLIPLFGSAAVYFERVVDDERINLLRELLKASFLLIQNSYKDDNSNSNSEEMKQCLQISYRSIQCFLTIDDDDPEIALLLIDLLNALIQKVPIFAKKIITERNLFQYIQTLIENESSSFPSLQPIIQLLSQT